MAEPLTADEIAAETPTDRTVRLALRAGRYKTERDDARAERDDAYSLTDQVVAQRDEARAAIARVRAVIQGWHVVGGISGQVCGDLLGALDGNKGSDRAAEPLSALARTNGPPADLDPSATRSGAPDGTTEETK